MSTNTKPLLLLGGLGALGLLALAAAAGSTDTAKTTWRHGMDWIDRVIDRVSKHEGKHDSLNLNLDGAGLSFSIIQWAQIVGNLGKLLTAMQQADPATFAATFGPRWQELLAVTNAATRSARMQPVGGAVLWKEPWVGRFLQAGRTPVFVQVQNQLAAQGHHWVVHIGRPNPWNPSRTDFAEFGRVVGTSIGVREIGAATWTPQTLEQVSALKLEPGHLEPEWPEDPRADQAIEEHIDQQLRWGGSMASLNWRLATDTWLTRTWTQHGQRVVQHLARARSWYAQSQKVPAVVKGKLRIAQGAVLQSPELVVLPPTEAGWKSYLELAPASELKFTELDQAAEYWWDRRIPRDLLSKARRDAEAEQGQGGEA
jgi:hypothetical protein